ncbi:MAG TPA: lysophospholipid acyltransferase family protein [Terriglobales bacterium]|nr:lysophospholipid acyltransferase family protein [Terriglobales bacterium]
MPEPAQFRSTDDAGLEVRFTFRQRLALWFISAFGAAAIRLIGPTLRYRVEIEPGGPPEPLLVPAIYCFWHRCVFASAYFYRDRDVAVMTSRSFDGEYIARIIQKLGFRAIRGSSSRGAVGALLAMHKEIEDGRTVAFTIDGPRGPRYVAKPGPVLLAKNTGVPIVCFHMGLEKAWILDSWDGTMIPKPFSRALLRISRVIPPPPDAEAESIEHVHQEMQSALERLRDDADERVATKLREPDF